MRRDYYIAHSRAIALRGFCRFVFKVLLNTGKKGRSIRISSHKPTFALNKRGMK